MKNLSEAYLNNGAAVGPQSKGRESLSTFPAYPAYKDSRVEWVDTLPTHWEKVALKWVSRIYAGGTPDKTKTHYWENGSIPWLNSGAVNQVLISKPSAFITTEAFNSSSARWIPSGSLVMALAGQGKTKGLVAQLAIRTTCNQSMAAIIPAGNANPRYLFWWLSNNYQNIRNMAGGDLRDGLNLELIGDIPALMPSEEEQTQIALFLDHETARIDSLIEEQQRLIELLKEKRQAVISRAVTKGLDQTLPMKDSGVEWMGEVPVHWVVKALRYLGECQNGINIGGEAFGSGSPFVSYGDVYKSDVLPAEVTGLVRSSPEDQQRYSIEYGDVFFTRTSETVDEIGFSATCLRELPNAVFAGFLIRFRPTGKSLTPGFSRYYFRNQGLRSFFNKEMNLVTRASLSQDLLKLLPVPLPPVVEQIKISKYLDRVTAEFASLLAQGIKAIDLLKERRSALVSSAVTGKIDVRGWQPSDSVPTPELAQEAV